MRDLLSKAREQKGEGLFSQHKEKRLEFSNISKCVYDKHNSQIHDIFLNPNINTLVSYNDKFLQSWNPKTKELISIVNFNELDLQTKVSKSQGSSNKPQGPAGNPQNLMNSISCLCYSQKYNLYFACSKNFKLIVFNEHLNIVHKQDIPVSLVQHITFYEEENQIIAGGKEGCFIIDLFIKFKYYPMMAILLDPKGQSITVRIKSLNKEQGEIPDQKDLFKSNNQDAKNEVLPVNYSDEYGPYIKQLQGFNQWVHGLKVFEDQNLIVAWKKDNQAEDLNKQGKITPYKDQVIFYSLKNQMMYQQGEVWSKFFDPQIKEDFITDVLVYKKQNFFITSHHLGDIHLRKLVEIKNIEVESNDPKTASIQAQNNSKSVHIFKGHSKAVTALAPIESKQSQFVSASTDGKVRIWCFEKMIELYCFDIQVDSPVQNSASADIISNVKLISQDVYAIIFKKGLIEIGMISHLVSSNFITKQSILGVRKCFKNEEDKKENLTQNLVINFDDNSVIVYNPFEKYVQSTIYPPPTPAEVKQAFFCMCIQRMFLFLRDGSICIYNVQEETGILEKLSDPKSLKDYEGKQLNQQITSMSCCYTEPPKIDCEIFSDLFMYIEPANYDYDIIKDQSNGKSDQFLVYGLSKGSVIFVKVNDLDHIFARFSIHREAIEQIHELVDKKVFLSICKEKILQIWGFENNKLENYQYFDLYREVITIIISNNEQMLLCFKKGDSELLVWNHQQKQLSTPLNMFSNQTIGDRKIEEKMKMKMDKSDEHENEITCFDVLTKKGLYVTGDSEGIIKIWNCQKQLVRDIRFVDPINSVCFLNEDADILIGHSGNLSRLNSVDYNDKKTEITQNQFYKLSQATKQIDQKLFYNLKKETEKHSKKENDFQSQSTCSIISDKNSALSMKNKQNENANEFELQVHRVTLNEHDHYKNFQKNHTNSQDDHHAESIQQGHNLRKSNQRQIQKQPHHAAPLKTSVQLIQIQDAESQSKMDVQDRLSDSSSDSDLTPLQKEEKDLNLIIELRQECSKVKSVQYNIQGVDKPINKKKKQMNSNFTRRIMTQNRIINNIQLRNNPEIPVRFNDFLVSCKTSSDLDIQSAFNQSNFANGHYGNTKSVAFNQTQQSSHLSQKHGRKFADNSKSYSSANAPYQDNSQLSNNRDTQIFKKKVQKQSNMQLALQKMANSSNTFLVTENNNFEPNRVKNHKLIKTIEKNGKIQELNSLLKNDDKSLKKNEFNQNRNINTETSVRGIDAAQNMSQYLQQSNQPQQFINLYKNEKMHSNQYLIGKNRKEENEKQFQNSTLKEGYDQSPSIIQNSSPQNKYLNSTLMKTQSTMGRNQGEVNVQISESPTRLMYIGEQISNGETELKREIIKNNENLKQLAAIVDHKIGFKFSNQNTTPLNKESLGKNQEIPQEKFELNITQANNFQKSSAQLNSNNHELHSQHDQPTIYHPSVNKLENVSILSQNFNKEQKISVNQDKEDDYSQNVSPMRLQRAQNSSSYTQPLFVSKQNDNIQVQNNFLQQSENHNSRMQVIQKVNHKNNDKKDNENFIQLNKKLVQQEIYDEYNINMNVNKSPNKKIQSISNTNPEGRDASELATPSPVSNAQKLQNINSQILLVQKKHIETEQKEIEIKKIEIQENGKVKNMLSDVNMFNSRILGTQRFQNTKQFVCTRLQMRANQLQSYRPHLVTNTTLNQIIKTAIEGDKLPSKYTRFQELPHLQNESKIFSSPLNHPVQSSTIYTQNKYPSNNPTFEIAERTVITQNNKRTKQYKNQRPQEEDLSVDKLRNFQNTELNQKDLYKKFINKVDSDVNSSQQPSTNFKWDNTQNILQNNWPIITQNKTNIEKYDSQNSSNLHPVIPVSIQQNNIFLSQNSDNRIHNSLDGRAINLNSQARPYDHPIFMKSLISQDIKNQQDDILVNQNIGRKPQTAGNGAKRQFKNIKSLNQNKRRDNQDQLMQQQLAFGFQRGLMQSAQNDSKYNNRKMSSYQSNMKNLQIIQKFAVIQQKQHDFQKQFIDYNPYNISNPL